MVWKVSGVYQKATFKKKKKWQHQNFCSWSENWFYATYFPLFLLLFLFLVLPAHWSLLCRKGAADAFKLFFFPQQIFNSVPRIQWFCFCTLVVVLQSKRTSLVWVKTKRTIQSSSSQREKKPQLDFWCMFEPFLSVCCSVAQRRQVGVWLSTMNLILRRFEGSCWTMW